MSKKRTRSQANLGIQADTITAQAIAVGEKSQATVNQQLNEPADDIAAAFGQLFDKINHMPDGEDKAVAEKATQALEKEAQKGQQAEEATVRKWLLTLAQLAPDVFEVAIATFVNPIQGLSVVFQRIAQKAREEQKR